MKICKLCNKPFKSSCIIDGKRISLADRKYCLECSPFKAHNTKALLVPRQTGEIKLKVCVGCKQELPLSAFWKKSPTKYQSRCKICLYKYQEDRRQPVKKLLLQYKGGKCVVCGYNKCVAALDFHHIDPSQKDFAVGRSLKNMNITKVEKELDKCVILCSNCHREFHFGDLNLENFLRPHN